MFMCISMRHAFVCTLITLLPALTGCSQPIVSMRGEPPTGASAEEADRAATHGGNGVDYLDRWPGLFVRDGDKIVDAPDADVRLARSYPSWPDKGTIIQGTRLTVMAEGRTYQVVRVIHVLDITEPGQEAYVMGPKPVLGEHVDGVLATPPAQGEDPTALMLTDGLVLPSPVVDYNFDITEYRFDTAGTHEISWRMGALVSNTLRIVVSAP